MIYILILLSGEREIGRARELYKPPEHEIQYVGSSAGGVYRFLNDWFSVLLLFVVCSHIQPVGGSFVFSLHRTGVLYFADSTATKWKSATRHLDCQYGSTVPIQKHIVHAGRH